MLLTNQEMDMSSQRDIFIKTLEEWMNYPTENANPIGQVDDIILIGIRI